MKKKHKDKPALPSEEQVGDFTRAILDLRNKMTEADFQDELVRHRKVELAYVDVVANLKLSAGGSIAAALLTSIALRHAADICDHMADPDKTLRRKIAFAIIGAITQVAAIDIDQMEDSELDGKVMSDELH